jgi:hypothetical protein
MKPDRISKLLWRAFPLNRWGGAAASPSAASEDAAPVKDATQTRRTSRWNHLSLVAVVILLWAGTGLASVSVEKVTWDSGPVPGWGWSGDATSLTTEPAGGNLNGFLALNFDAALPITYQSAQVSNSSAGYTGDYRGYYLTFDLLGYGASDYELFFVSSASGSNETWYLTFLDKPTVDQAWQPYNPYVITFAQTQWGGWYGGAGNFMNALSQVDSIGLIVYHSGTEVPMMYGIDNWQLQLTPVPEPEVGIMAIVLVMSGLFWMRRVISARRISAQPRPS